ncbi:sensor histidine kinase [Thiopseudomonas acetoxidans]|uniref:histidine kinase n=1 Tax=Thiopseudomonas acetoxidans TaxID=3041622 RepID=A0ABT7SRX4_9GAMM|nr:ATP-binding protein [Thiopseudomonas sp. CY1220]MDM7858739.1 ATP-binding protein [Thiopseudomonas sp. CY1220]
MSTKVSLQRTLGLSLTIGIIVLWLLGVAAAGLVARYKMNDVFDSALEETAQRILPLAVTEILNRENDTGPQRAPMLKAHDEYLTYLVRKPSGEILLQSHDVEPELFSPLPREGFSDTATHRFYGASAVSGTIYIEVAEPLAHRRAAVLETSLALLIPLLLLIPVSLLGVWWLIRRSLRRVVMLQQSIEARGGGDLSSVYVARLPQEFEPVVNAVNHLLERLRRTLEAERSFTANSAHELRTPLASALAKLQRLQAKTQDEQVRVQAEEIEGSLRTLARLSEKLLELAKAEGGSALAENDTDLVPILRMIVSDYQHKASGHLKLDVPDTPVMSLLDSDAFAILIRNLIDNALKHGARQQPITISLTDKGVLRVVNAGEVVPPEKLALVRRRFVRSDTKSLGSGIGLAIVDAIASGAGIELSLRSPASGQRDGFEAELNIVVTRTDS